MNPDKIVYDASQGGDTKIKDVIHTYEYAAANLKEMDNLINEIKKPVSTKLVFQSLPKHMRRRAMSHNPKRLPRKYRRTQISQMSKSGPPKSSKRPSRKFRRKPSNLLKDYVRRQRTNIWLETHIWHAKRFHMVDKWGYKLPYASCDKTYRACYRASAKHCLLQDISYHACIELKGSTEDIRSAFSRLTSPKCGPGIAAKMYTSGVREGTVHIFKKDQYPRCCLGKVSFFWKPQSTDSEKRVLWIFVHPSFYKILLQELFETLQLRAVGNTIKIPLSSAEENSDKFQFLTKSSAFNRIPKYTSQICDIELSELKDTLNRFRLTGPLSQAVLSKVLKSSAEDGNQSQLWSQLKDCNSPAELLSNMVLGLVVEDFRLNKPKKRTKAVALEGSKANTFYAPDPEVAKSAIWDYETRSTLVRNMCSTKKLNEERNKNVLVPGEPCNFESSLQPIPILLIQRPGSQNHRVREGYSTGWDIILPTGYGSSLWLSLIMWGCRPGGLREITSINRELGCDTFLPDTVSGSQEIADTSLSLRSKYFRLPPNKRCNYVKFSISSPFAPPLQQLSAEWSADSGDYYILRDVNVLRTLSPLPKHIDPDVLKCYKGSLIAVSLTLKTRGNPGDLALICLPKKPDFKNYLKMMKYKRNDPICTEPLQVDPNESERKLAKRNHKTLLKRLRSKRVRDKRKLQKTSTTVVKIAAANTRSLVEQQLKRMCDLWLPSKPPSIRNQCSREVIGYVTQSAFALGEGQVSAIGYVTIEGLDALLKMPGKIENLVLLRGNKTRHYRFATITINTNI